MQRELLDVDSLDDTSYKMLQEYKERVQFPVFEYEAMLDYPPFKLNANSEKAQQFRDMLWKLFYDGNDLLKYELPEKFRPYAQIESSFSDELKQARFYKDKSGDNPALAMKLFIEDFPKTQTEDSDFWP